MTARALRVVPLATHPHLVAPLADAFAAEWPQWCASVGRARIERCFACSPAGGLPQAFAALDGERVAGTISLQPWFAEEPMEETPWVRGLLVLPDWRGGPAYRLLADAVEDAAQALGYSNVYAATTSIEALIRRRGWEVFRRVERDGNAFAWLRKALPPRRNA